MQRRPNEHFIEEDIQMANMNMRRCTSSLAFRKMQIKTTMKYHYTPTKMAIIKTSDNIICWPGHGRNWKLLYYWWECKMI